MRIPVVPFLIFFSVCLLADTYIYVALRKRSRGNKWPAACLVSSIVLYLWLIISVALPRRGSDDGQLRFIMWSLFGIISVYLPKIMFVLSDLIASVPLLFHRKRLRIVSKAGGVLAVVLFLAMWWGALFNRYNINVTECEVSVYDLPAAFDGYRIAQISDLHVGTYMSDTAFVEKLVDSVMALKPDLVVFTGDIVNRRSDELEPHWRVLSRLSAPDGVYAILGNHDYGDYSDWANDAMKGDNMCALYDYYGLMGWKLLLNDHAFISRGNDSIALVGVENVGDPPFKVYGSLKDSYPDLSDGMVKILLSHNPAHWAMEIADNENVNIALTLAGHTHAMQISVAGLSPAAWRYEHWGGLYYDKRGKNPLYVNIGAGTVGLPMRMGATPEITVITLKR